MVFREGNGTPLQYSYLENPMDGGAWWAAVHGVAEGRTRLSDFTFTFHFHALEKEMASHSSVLAWRIPGMVEPGGLLSMGSHRVGHNWSDSAAAAAAEMVLFTPLVLCGFVTHYEKYDCKTIKNYSNINYLKVVCCLLYHTLHSEIHSVRKCESESVSCLVVSSSLQL